MVMANVALKAVKAGGVSARSKLRTSEGKIFKRAANENCCSSIFNLLIMFLQ